MAQPIPDRLVVRTLLGGRINPSSNCGHGIFILSRRGDVEVNKRRVPQYEGGSVSST